MKKLIGLIFLMISISVFSAEFRVLTPRTIRPNPTLITLLHGCTQSGPSFLGLTHFEKYIEEKNLIVLLPEQSWLRNPGKCWNWFVGENALGQNEYNSIVSLIKQYALMYQVKGSYLYGFSAGSAMGSNLIAKNSELFDGVLLHSGYPYNGGGIRKISDFDLYDYEMSFEEFWSNLSISSIDELTLLRNKMSGFHPRLKNIVIVSGQRDLIAANKYSKASFVQFLDQRAKLTKKFQLDYSVYQGQGAWRTTLYQFHQMGHSWSGGNDDYLFAAPELLDITRESFLLFGL